MSQDEGFKDNSKVMRLGSFKDDSKVMRLGSFLFVPCMELVCFKTLQQCAQMLI
jgi:hypothetical protein